MQHPFIDNYGVLLDDFENIDDWFVGGINATKDADTVLFKQGNQSIKLNVVDGNVGFIEKSGLNLDFSSEDIFTFWCYIEDIDKKEGLALFIASQEDWSKHFYTGISFALLNGWNYVVFNKSQFVSVGGETWDNVMTNIKFRYAPTEGKSTSINIDDFRFGMVSQPKVIMTFDDNYVSQINNAYPIMAINNQRGVLFSYTNAIGHPPYMTLADLQTLKVAGWDISNHTASHKNLTIDEGWESDIDAGYDWLVVNGFEDTAKFFAYPYGMWNDSVVAKVKQRHILARGNSSIYHHFDILDFNDLQYKLAHFNAGSPNTVETILARINETIQKNGLLILMFHDIVDVNPEYYNCLIADFQIISNYLRTKQDAGELDVITFSDYYNALMEREKMAQITLSILNGQWSDFQKYFLKRRPIPLDGQQEPIMSVIDWIKKCIVDGIYQTLLEGKQMEAFNELEIDIDIS